MRQVTDIENLKSLHELVKRDETMAALAFLRQLASKPEADEFIAELYRMHTRYTNRNYGLHKAWWDSLDTQISCEIERREGITTGNLNWKWNRLRTPDDKIVIVTTVDNQIVSLVTTTGIGLDFVQTIVVEIDTPEIHAEYGLKVGALLPESLRYNERTITI